MLSRVAAQAAGRAVATDAPPLGPPLLGVVLTDAKVGRGEYRY